MSIGIYRITSPSGKIYVGQSINIEKRWYFYNNLYCKEQVKLYNSLMKYGVSNHVFEIVEICEEKKLNELEIYYSDLYDCLSQEKGLNLKVGGGGRGRTSEETKKKISLATIGKKKSDETRKRMSESGIGRIFSDETKKRMSESAKNKKPATMEWRNNHSRMMMGRKASEETKEKIRESNRTRIVSDETKKKMSETAKRRPPRTIEWRDSHSKKMTGRKREPFSDEHRKRISVAAKKNW